MSIRQRVCEDDVRRVRVRANALQRDVYVRACAPLRRVNVDDAGHRVNARANASLLRAYVRVHGLSLSLLLLLNVNMLKHVIINRLDSYGNFRFLLIRHYLK